MVLSNEWVGSFLLVVVHLCALSMAATLIASLANRPTLNRYAFGLIAIAFIVQCLLCFVLIWNNGFTGLERSSYLQFLVCMLLGGGLFLWLKKTTPFILLMTAFVALSVCLIGYFLQNGHAAVIPENVSVMFTVAHVGGFFSSFALLMFATGAGVLFLVQERLLKLKTRPSSLYKDFPALSVLDKINALCTLIGFPLFTVALLFGFIGARVAWGTIFSGDPKELFSLFVWALFALLFHQRLAKGWQGRKPAVLAILIFVASVFSLIVINMFVPTHHSFFTYAG